MICFKACRLEHGYMASSASRGLQTLVPHTISLLAQYFQEQLAQPAPTAKLSDLLADVDAKTTAC